MITVHKDKHSENIFLTFTIYGLFALSRQPDFFSYVLVSTLPLRFAVQTKPATGGLAVFLPFSVSWGHVCLRGEILRTSKIPLKNVSATNKF